MGGFDPYSSSKGCAELVTAAYRNSFFNIASFNEHQVALASARAGNVIGGGDWAEDRLIPDILRAFEKGMSVNIRNPASTRPWQHVLEPLSGYLALAERLTTDGPAYADAFNFGPVEEDAQTVQWIVEELTKHWGDGASWYLDCGSHPHEAHYLKLDCSKARSSLGWTPRWHLSQALQTIIDWHKAYKCGQDMRALCLQQIAAYSSAN
jgi:CDP-glucose 4,6-dehydratase